jgi:hypothetical protein
MCTIASLEKSRAVAHWFVNNKLARRQLDTRLIAGLSMGADRRRPRIASAQVVSADADVGETLNRPERGVVHFYADVFAPLVG